MRIYSEFEPYDDLEGYQFLVAHVLMTAVKDVCTRARNMKHGALEYAMRELARDRGCIYWAESIDISWPPDKRIIDDIITALRNGEQVWPSQLWLEK